nr:MAG TPA: hypothetical protein [Crassvirales sp.]
MSHKTIITSSNTINHYELNKPLEKKIKYYVLYLQLNNLNDCYA